MMARGLATSLHWALVLVLLSTVLGYKRREDKTKCPEVKAVKNFDLNELLGHWFVVEYYASAEEALAYSCMNSVFTEDDAISSSSGLWQLGVTMNFTYSFADDPSGARLLGNITWRVDPTERAHWTHSEETYEGVYNTYVLDTEYKSWALLLHCAEKAGTARYLSAFVMSRNTTLPANVLSYLRDKLPRYDVDARYVFPVAHDHCTTDFTPNESPLLVALGAAAGSGKVVPIDTVEQKYDVEVPVDVI